MQVTSRSQTREASDTADLARKLTGFFRYAATTSDGPFLREVSEQDLSISQIKTLSLLAEQTEELSVKSLAERLGISLPAASRAVEPLVQRRLVERREDPDDRRVKRVRTTAAGDALVERLVAARMAAFEELVRGLSASQRRKLGDALDSILTRPEIAHCCPREGRR